MAKSKHTRHRKRSAWRLTTSDCIRFINKIPSKYWPKVRQLQKQGIKNERLLSYCYGKGYLPSYPRQ